MKRLLRHRLLIVCGLATVLALSYFGLVHRPQATRIAGIEQEIASLSDQQASAENLLASAGVTAKTSGTVRSEREQLIAAVYTADSLEQFLDQVTLNLEAYGLEAVAITPDVRQLITPEFTEVGDLRLQRLNFEVKCQGQFLNIGRAMERFERLPYFASLAYLNLNYDAVLDPLVLCSFRFSAFLRQPGGAS